MRATVCAILGMLLLAGCGMDRLNPGAAVPIYEADGIAMAQLAAQLGLRVDPSTLCGLATFDDNGMPVAIHVRRGLPARLRTAVTVHEVGHHLERRYGPGVWDLLDAYASPAFPCGRDR